MNKLHIYKIAPKDFPNDFDYICLTQEEYESEGDMEEDDVFTYEYMGEYIRYPFSVQ